MHEITCPHCETAFTIDEAGYACATNWAKRYCVTAFIGSIRFHHPIMIGDLVEVDAVRVARDAVTDDVVVLPGKIELSHRLNRSCSYY